MDASNSRIDSDIPRFDVFVNDESNNIYIRYYDRVPDEVLVKVNKQLEEFYFLPRPLTEIIVHAIRNDITSTLRRMVYVGQLVRVRYEYGDTWTYRDPPPRFDLTHFSEPNLEEIERTRNIPSPPIHGYEWQLEQQAINVLNIPTEYMHPGKYIHSYACWVIQNLDTNEYLTFKDTRNQICDIIWVKDIMKSRSFATQEKAENMFSKLLEYENLTAVEWKLEK